LRNEFFFCATLFLTMRCGAPWDLNDVTQQEEQTSILLVLLDGEERHPKVRTDFALCVETYELRVLQASFGEVHK
jgi:hypothetical protein